MNIKFPLEKVLSNNVLVKGPQYSFRCAQEDKNEVKLLR